MAISNQWTNPLRRAYQSIKADLLDGLTKITDSKGNPLITDISEGNILVVILDLFAGIAEMLHYYIDNMARECFISTARRYSSVTKLGNLVDYKPRLANAATTDVILTRELTGENSGAEIKIPKGTQFQDNSGNKWESAIDVVWGKNTTTCKIPLIQHELYTSSILNGTNYVLGNLQLDTNLGGALIEDGTVNLSLGGENWEKVNTFSKSKPTDKHFILTESTNGTPIIVFGDGKFGAKPKEGLTINISFYITNGSKGNISSSGITSVPNEISSIVPGVTCNNPYDAGDGLDYEDIETLRSHIPLWASTMGVAITKEDFINLAKLVPGVQEAALEYICGRKLNIYISPYSGIASSTLLNKVKNYLEQYAPMTTWLNVYAAGEAHIVLDIEVTGKPSYTTDTIKSDILQALYNSYSQANAQIGGKVRISDIYALIDNLPSVDFLYIKKFYVNPWPTIIFGDTSLDLTLTALNKAKGSMTYICSFIADNTFKIYSSKGNYESPELAIGNVTIDDTKNGFNFSLVIQGNYNQGSKYSFTISEPNHDYEEPGYNRVAFWDPSKLTLKVNEVL